MCRALGMDTSKGTVHRHLGAISEDEKRMAPRPNVSSSDVSFPNRSAFCVSEGGPYKLIMRSDKPEARAFQDWVTRVVLPAIPRLRLRRSDKDGAYVMGEEKVRTGLRLQRPRNPHPRHRREPLVRGGRVCRALVMDLSAGGRPMAAAYP